MLKWVNSLVKRTSTIAELKKRISVITAVLGNMGEMDIRVTVRDGAIFYVPNCVEDGIQMHIFFQKNYFENDILIDLDKRIPEKGIFFDISANIGNHSIYWAKRGDRTIYAFEPVRETFSILNRNVELNNLQQVIRCKNVGIGADRSRAEIVFFERGNIGGTQIAASVDGDLILDSIDNLVEETGGVDFIKIDAEGFEKHIIEGAIAAISRYLPIIFIEVFPENEKEVFGMLKSLGYKLEKRYPKCNFLFTHHSRTSDK